MAFGSKQKKQRLLVISVSRVLIAVCAALSFLATVVPAGFSSAQQTMMDCCIGKPGHEAEACSSGLLASLKFTGPEAFAHHDDGAQTTIFEVSAGVHAQPIEETPAPTSQTEGSERPKVDTVSRACRGECGTCSTSFSRQPRPREQSTQTPKASLNLPTGRVQLDSEFLHTNALKIAATQLQPRAPPMLAS